MALTGFSSTDYLFRAAAVWPGAEPFFVNAWQFRPQGTSQGDGWALSNSGVQDEFRIRINNGNTICQEEDGGVVSNAGTGIQPPDSTWFSQQADFNTSIQVWLNAANNASTGGGSATGFDETRVGRSLYGSIFQTGWAIAEVSIWNTSGFSEANLDSLAALLHNGGAGGNGANPIDVNAQAAQPWTGALVAYWRLQNTSDICDLSGNGHDLSIVGSLSNFGTHPPVDSTAATCGVELIADAGAVAIAGQDALFRIDSVLNADPGSVPIVGQNADLLLDRVLIADPGALPIVGNDADFVIPGQFVIDADPGSIAILGQDAFFLVSVSAAPIFCQNCGKAYKRTDENVNFFFVSSEEIVGVESPVLIGVPIEIDQLHDSVIVPIVGTIPFGATVFLDFTTSGPNPDEVSIVDSRGNVYREQVREGASNLFKGFLNLPLLDGNRIEVRYSSIVGFTSLVAYYITGITDADAADSDHTLNQDTVGPIVVPNGGVAVASAYAFSVAGADGFVQDPLFTDIGAARVDITASVTRTVFSSSRQQGGTYAYAPTLIGTRRLTIASYAPVGSIKFKRGSYTSPRRIADVGAQILACPVDPMLELDRAMDRGDPYPHRATKR